MCLNPCKEELLPSLLCTADTVLYQLIQDPETSERSVNRPTKRSEHPLLRTTNMSRLLTLPPVLQNIIFEYALQSDKSVLIGSARCEVPGLLRSCRLLRQQYLAMYYHNNIFEFETLQGDSGGYVATRIRKWSTDIPEEHISMIKHVRVQYNLKVGTEQWILGFDDCIPKMQSRRRKMTLVRQCPDGSINQTTISSLRREVRVSNDMRAVWGVFIVKIILFCLNMPFEGTSQLDKSRLREILFRVWLE